MEPRGKGDRTSYRGSRRPLQDTPINVAYSSPTRAPALPNYSKPRAFDKQEQQQAIQQTPVRLYKQTDSYGSPVAEEYVGDISSPVDTPSSPPSQKPNVTCTRAKAQVGPWLLGRTLGKGSSGRVRLAKHVETGQLAAIKIVGKGNDDTVGENGQERPLPPGLEREVVIMKLICHPNVMGLWDVWENRGELYLVLEYIEGGELFDYLTRRGRLPEIEALMYFRQILSGIDYCQHFNICHRDLKPENLLLDANGNIKIADFGMAALQPHGSLLDTPCGSPHYASPEIVSGKHYDGGKSDIWSCGIILFALLAGYLPFDDDNIRKLLQKVMKGRFIMPAEFSIEAKDLITRMLTVDPEERISIEEIWAHPLVERYAPLDPVTGEETDRGPRPPRSRDIGRPVRYKNEIDGEILKNLQTLWQGVEENTLIERLLSNVHNQEKVFYCLLMKYRYEHLENYPGTSEERKNSQTSNSSASTYLPPRRIGNRQGRRAGTVARRGRHRANSGASVTGREIVDYRPPTRGKSQAELIDDDERVNYHAREKAGDRLRSVRERRGVADHRNRNSLLQPRGVSSRVSATGSIRHHHHHLHSGNANSASGRYRSRSSLASHASASPSLFKSNSHFKRRVSFNHTTSLNNRLGRAGESIVSKNLPQDTVWVDDERGTRAQAVGFDREDTPQFVPSPGIFIPKGRKESTDTTKRRSTFANDGVAMDGKAIHASQPNRSAYHANEQQDAERRRIVSKELEAACDRAFGSLGSLKTLSTVRSVCETSNISSHTVDSAAFNNLTISSTATIRTQKSRRDDDERPLPSLPPEALIRKCSNGRSTLRIFDDDETDPDKGYLDDVLEHFDKLMERPISFPPLSNQPRAVSQGSKPLNLASTNNTIPMPHIFEKEKIAKLEAQNQGLGITRGGVGSRSRVVSAPQPSRNVSLASRHPNLQSDILGRFDKFEPAPLRIRPKSVVKRQVPVDRAGDGSRNSRHLNQLPVVKDESTGFDPELILPSARADGRRSLRLVNGETRAIAVKVNPVMSGALATVVVDPPTKEVKKKRSFFDVLKGKNKIAPEPKDPVIEEVVAGETKGTFGRRSGNLLKRWASRDAGGLLAFGSSNDRGDTQSIANGLTSCFMTPQDSKEGSDCFGGSEEDQFTKVMSQRNWFMKFLNVKPASRVICFTISPVATRKEIMKLWKEWVKYGLVIVEDDRKSLVVRARVKTPNSLNIKEVSFVGEIRAYGGSRKTGSGVVRFTQERGAASSFNRVIGEMAKKFSEKGIILPED